MQLFLKASLIVFYLSLQPVWIDRALNSTFDVELVSNVYGQVGTWSGGLVV